MIELYVCYIIVNTYNMIYIDIHIYYDINSLYKYTNIHVDSCDLFIGSIKLML